MASNLNTQESTFYTTTSAEPTPIPGSTLSLEITSPPESTTMKYPQFTSKILTRAGWGAIEPKPGIKNLTISIQLKSLEFDYNHLKNI